MQNPKPVSVSAIIEDYYVIIFHTQNCQALFLHLMHSLLHRVKCKHSVRSRDISGDTRLELEQMKEIFEEETEKRMIMSVSDATSFLKCLFYHMEVDITKHELIYLTKQYEDENEGFSFENLILLLKDSVPHHHLSNTMRERNCQLFEDAGISESTILDIKTIESLFSSCCEVNQNSGIEQSAQQPTMVLCTSDAQSFVKCLFSHMNLKITKQELIYFTTRCGDENEGFSFEHLILLLKDFLPHFRTSKTIMEHNSGIHNIINDSCVTGSSNFLYFISDDGNVSEIPIDREFSSFGKPSRIHFPSKIREISCNEGKDMKRNLVMLDYFGTVFYSTDISRFVKILDFPPIRTITCGKHKIFCICYGGELYMDKTFEGYTERHKVEAPRKVKTISAGPHHSILILDDGSLMGKGDNTYGQLGFAYSSQEQRIDIFRIIPSKVKFIDVSCDGMGHSVFLSSTGEVYSCGSNSHGQLGPNSKREISNKPSHKILKVDHLSNIVKVCCTAKYTLCVDNQGTVFHFGEVYGTSECVVSPTVINIRPISGIWGGVHPIVKEKDRALYRAFSMPPGGFESDTPYHQELPEEFNSSVSTLSQLERMKLITERSADIDEMAKEMNTYQLLEDVRIDETTILNVEIVESLFSSFCKQNQIPDGNSIPIELAIRFVVVIFDSLRATISKEQIRSRIGSTEFNFSLAQFVHMVKEYFPPNRISTDLVLYSGSYVGLSVKPKVFIDQSLDICQKSKYLLFLSSITGELSRLRVPNSGSETLDSLQKFPENAFEELEIIQFPDETEIISFRIFETTAYCIGKNHDVWKFDVVCQTPEPERIPELLGIKAIACSESDILFFTVDGTVLSQVDNKDGQLSLGDSRTTLRPVVEKVFDGTTSCFALCKNGSIWACGTSPEFSRGLSYTGRSYLWCEQIASTSSVVHIQVISYMIAFLLNDGTVAISGKFQNQHYKIPTLIPSLKNIQSMFELKPLIGRYSRYFREETIQVVDDCGQVFNVDYYGISPCEIPQVTTFYNTSFPIIYEDQDRVHRYWLLHETNILLPGFEEFFYHRKYQKSARK